MHYIGIDLHKKTISLCVMSKGRKILCEKVLRCDDEAAILADQVEMREFAPRQRIYKIGDVAGTAYVVMSGTVRVTTVDEDQQEVLLDLLNKIKSQPLALPGLISTLGSTVHTDFPANQLADYVEKGQAVVSSGTVKQIVLGPPYQIAVSGMDCLLNGKLAALSIQWFGTDSTWYGKPTPANTCP